MPLVFKFISYNTPPLSINLGSGHNQHFEIYFFNFTFVKNLKAFKGILLLDVSMYLHSVLGTRNHRNIAKKSGIKCSAPLGITFFSQIQRKSSLLGDFKWR